MNEAFIDSETVRVDFPDGNWVDVKQELTQEDQDYILSQMTQGEIKKDSQFSLKLGNLALLESFIVSWSFQDGGKAIQVTRDTISNLKGKYRSLILSKINGLQETANEFVSKNA